MAVIYANVPTVAVFVKDSAVTFGTRSGDPVLVQIEEALAQYHQQAGLTEAEQKLHRTLTLARLYFATDLWLKEAAKGRGSAGRKPAVQALFECVCKQLVNHTGVPINLLPNWFTSTFARGINLHAVELDHEEKLAKYMSAGEVEKFRIQFQSGRAYQRQWWLASANLVYAESSRSVPQGQKSMQDGHSGYVMSIGGDFFMQKHSTSANAQASNIYHSSYLAGNPVRCAGTWKVVNGVVEEISDASGHYRPTQDHMIGAVETLKAYGVNLATLKVFIYPDTRVGIGATKFLAEAPRTSLLQRRQAFITQQDEVMAELERLRLRAIQSGLEAKARVKAEFEEMVAHFRAGVHPEGKRTVTKFNCKRCNTMRERWPEAEAAARLPAPAAVAAVAPARA